LVEGGAKLAANFLHSGLVNRLVLYQTAKLMGNRGLPWAKHINLEEMNVSGMPTNEWKLERVNIIDESDFCVEYVKMT
jgi:riboflavin biosynthesis pyrimidine reductase